MFKFRLGYLAVALIGILAFGVVSHAAEESRTGTLPGEAGVVNINTASVDQLRILPGVSKKLAENIIDYRNTNGPFRSVDEIQNVKGMSKAEFNEIKHYLVLEGNTTLTPEELKTKSSSPGSNYLK